MEYSVIKNLEVVKSTKEDEVGIKFNNLAEVTVWLNTNKYYSHIHTLGNAKVEVYTSNEDNVDMTTIQKYFN